MTALLYLESLIAGMKVSSLPIQASELELLKKILVAEQAGTSIFKEIKA